MRRIHPLRLSSGVSSRVGVLAGATMSLHPCIAPLRRRRVCVGVLRRRSFPFAAPKPAPLPFTTGNPKKKKETEKKFEELARFLGSELAGKQYTPPFDYFESTRATGSFRVITGDFVTEDGGTGVVHCAPAFGEDDYKVCVAHKVVAKDQLICPLDANGRFTDEGNGRGTQPLASLPPCAAHISMVVACILLVLALLASSCNSRGDPIPKPATSSLRRLGCHTRPADPATPLVPRPPAPMLAACSPIGYAYQLMRLPRVAVPEFKGLFVKDADKGIIQLLKGRGRMYDVRRAGLDPRGSGHCAQLKPRGSGR